MIIDEQCLAILKEIIKSEDYEEKDTLNCICYSHFVLLSSHFDLKTNQLNTVAIRERLLLTYCEVIMRQLLASAFSTRT